MPVLALAREAAGLFEILMEEKSQHLILEGDETAQVEGDSLPSGRRLGRHRHSQRVVKYSPIGETIALRVRRGEGGRILVEIQDHGPGIPAQDQPKVFDRFYRVDKARWRESGGAGLGLSIAKWAVEAHGGSIGLQSNGSQGCTFCISLPG